MVGEVVFPQRAFWSILQTRYELFVILSGEAALSFGRKRIRVGVGHVALVRPPKTVVCHFSSQVRTHQAWCQVDPRFAAPKMRRLLARAPLSQPMSRAFQQLLNVGLTIKSDRSVSARFALDTLSLALFGEYIRMGMERKLTVDESYVAKAVAYMETHFVEEKCLKEAVKASCISQNHLISCFRRDLGITPERFLWQLRVEQGLLLLVETALSISEIAYRCGFKTPFHFARLVRQQQGQSPREIRRLAKISRALQTRWLNSIAIRR